MTEMIRDREGGRRGKGGSGAVKTEVPTKTHKEMKINKLEVRGDLHEQIDTHNHSLWASHSHTYIYIYVYI